MFTIQYFKTIFNLFSGLIYETNIFEHKRS